MLVELTLVAVRSGVFKVKDKATSSSMGACMSSGGEQGSLESNQQSRFIDNKLREDEKRMAKEVKLLLLGTVADVCIAVAHSYRP